MLNFFAFLNHHFRKRSGLLEVYLELLVTTMRADTLFFHVFLREQVTSLLIFSPYNFFYFIRDSAGLARMIGR